MRQKYSAPNPYCVPTYRERGLKSGDMIKLLPKPLLRPVLSGKGFNECRDEQYICPKPLKGLKEWSVDVFYDKMNILTYPNGLHIPGIYPDFSGEPVPYLFREAWGVFLSSEGATSGGTLTKIKSSEQSVHSSLFTRNL